VKSLPGLKPAFGEPKGTRRRGEIGAACWKEAEDYALPPLMILLHALPGLMVVYVIAFQNSAPVRIIRDIDDRGGPVCCSNVDQGKNEQTSLL